MAEHPTSGERRAGTSESVARAGDPHHELNQLLTVILTHAELALRGLDRPLEDLDELRAQLGRLREHAIDASRLARLVGLPDPLDAAVAVREQALHDASAVRVLLVEDDGLVRETYLEALGYHGHRVTAVASGAEGLAHLVADRFDVVVTDLNMPGMSGLELARQAKELAPDMPIVLISGFSGQHEERRLRGAGVDYILDKPCPVQQLVSLVARVAGR